MKKLLLLFLLLPTISFGQLPNDFIMPHKDGKIIYEIINDSIAMTKNEIFAASKKWLSDTFVSSKAVIQSEDIETGQIIGQGIIKADNFWNAKGLFGVALNLQFNTQIDCRDNKYRIRIYEIKNIVTNSYLGERAYPIEGTIKDEMSDKQRAKFNDALRDANQKFINLIYDFQKSLVSAKDDAF